MCFYYSDIAFVEAIKECDNPVRYIELFEKVVIINSQY